MGFLLDRMALTAAAHPGILGAAARGESWPAFGLGGEAAGAGGWDSGSGESGGAAGPVELEVEFLMVAFSAAVNTTPAERIRQVRVSVLLCVGERVRLSFVVVRLVAQVYLRVNATRFRVFFLLGLETKNVGVLHWSAGGDT